MKFLAQDEVNIGRKTFLNNSFYFTLNEIQWYFSLFNFLYYISGK